MCSYLLGSQRRKQASWLQEASGILSSRNQRSRDQLFGFGAEQLDPVSEHLLNATPRALLGRMGGCCPQVAQPYGEYKTNIQKSLLL